MRDLCAGIGATKEPASGTTTATVAFALADAELLTSARPMMVMEMSRPSTLTVELNFDAGHQGCAVLARLRGFSDRVLSGEAAPSG